jgi:hypothetical protein
MERFRLAAIVLEADVAQKIGASYPENPAE